MVVFVYNSRFCDVHHIIYFHDRMVYYQDKNQGIKCLILYIYVVHDSTVSDGYVYDDQGSKPAEFG